MTRIESRFDIAGTYGNLVVYKVGNKLYARTKSSLTGKRFQKDPAFARSQEKAKAFGKASQLAKTIYASLPKEVKRQGLFGKLTGLVHKSFQEGKSKDALVKELQRQFGIVPPMLLTQNISPAALSSRRNQKQPQPFSSWLVTVEGRLQARTTLFLLYQQLSYKKTYALFPPDG